MIVADSSNAIAAIKSMFESPGKQMSEWLKRIWLMKTISNGFSDQDNCWIIETNFVAFYGFARCGSCLISLKCIQR